MFSDGRNVARQGKATQKNTAYGGDASQGHRRQHRAAPTAAAARRTPRKTPPNPWWEVDLGGEMPIDSIVVYNRTDDGLGKRLDGFTLKVLDGNRKVVFEKKKLPAPTAKAAFEVGGESPERVVRRAAMNALTSVRGQEADAFKALAKFVKRRRRPPRRHPGAPAHPRRRTGRRTRPSRCSTRCSPYIRKMPVAERTSPAALDALQLADALASLLPLAEAKQVRKELGELGVRVIRIGTVPEQMLFDKERIVVKAGKPVEIVFENNDLMPHNFVIDAARARWRRSARSPRRRPRSPARWSGTTCPASKKILLASRLLQPRKSQKLELHRADASRASIPTSAPTPATGGACTAPCTSSTTSTSTSPTRRATWPSTRCRSRTSC